MDRIIIQKKDFNLQAEIKIAKNKNVTGAIVSFIGYVRDLTTKTITKISLEHYPQMAEKSFKLIAEQAKKRWKIQNITIIHRVGYLSVNKQIVLVIVASRHRKEAFAACEFIIDYLKTDAPFWKKQHFLKTSKWMNNKSSDIKQKNKWQ